MKTFFTNSVNGNIIELTNDEHNHLKNVMRLNVGDKVKVVCGDDFNYFCVIKQINKNNSVLEVESKQVNLSNPKTNVTCYMALIKNDNLSLVVQKLTELGISNFVPFESHYTVNKDKGSKENKLNVISQQSLKQCGRSKPLNIYPTQKLLNLSEMLSKHDLIIFANESETTYKLNDVLSKNKSAKNIAYVIGCEGGFDNLETDFLIKNGAKSVTLGSRILRAETAAIMLGAIILNNFEEF